MMETYLLSYDTGTDIQPKMLEAFIASNKYIDEWSFLFGGAYFLKSDSDYETLYYSIDAFVEGSRFVMVKLGGVSRDYLNGRLATPVWQWLTNASDEDFAIAIEASRLREKERLKR